MKKATVLAILLSAVWQNVQSAGAEPAFVRMSDHCYYMRLNESGENVAAVATDDGILLINPPQEQELPAVLDSLAKISTKAVRWVVFTEPGLFRNAGSRPMAGLNPVFLAGTRFDDLALPAPAGKEAPAGKAPSPSRLIFERQMRLFPASLEIRIVALQHKARTGGDMVIFVPAEKVLFAGGLYEAARYPDIDAAADGNPFGWFDGMKQVIDAVPLLKSAIPAVKPASKTEPEKTLEEGITVVSSRGEPSNLQNMKDLLESARKLRNDVMRAAKAGRTCKQFLASAAADAYRSYGNFDSFATRLFEALAAR